MASLYVNDEITPKLFIKLPDQHRSNQKSFYMNKFVAYVEEQEKQRQVFIEYMKNQERFTRQLLKYTLQLQQRLNQSVHENEKVNNDMNRLAQNQREMNDEFTKRCDAHHRTNEEIKDRLHHQEQVEQETSDQINAVKSQVELQAEKIKELIVKHQLLNKNLQLKLDDLVNEQSPFRQLLQTLPPNYPISNLFVNGLEIDVSKFIDIMSESNIAHFIGDKTIKSIDCNKIDGLIW
ncbi:MAG TPA: hypothetical protein VF095_07020 [Bacillota bacterium]